MESGSEKNVEAVMDGSKIRDLVESDEVFNKFVERKFEELDHNRDGKLSPQDLRPALTDIGAALGLPAQGSSPDSDHIYDEVLSEFTHGNSGEVSKSQFKEVLSDILLGMAAGLKRDPIVILRIDGQDLSEFLKGPGFEPHAISVFSQIESTGTMLDYVESALHNFSVDHGMPPPSDPWVTSKVIEPALEANASCLEERNVTQEGFVESLKKVIESIALHLKEDPVIVAHSGNTFDGSSIKRLLSNKYELDKAMETTWKSLPKDRHERMSKEYLRVAYDIVAPAAGLPPYGAVNQVDEVVNEVFKMVKADEAGSCNEAEFNKLILEILGDIMLQLEGNPVTVSSNAVVNEPEAPTFLPAASNHGESE
ncbi:uncharacterized protein LOC18447103 isoform X2 [Amborella trichopoda]|uniref:EF-hand domain-containing protein n=1 Tax=Amborella trichopoda TaxID=13333 RepID=U5D936_AMBTC|nr:uncharacterized protein LOC18447103 isoform X2 [Amborella trichopoda]ERN18735.1 hypothetical protein AMTR_s00199p00040390 [Amborella trichopoda]|eukprot:XP_006857268.1 uncharacterized protein LOC18447103 isoform X2 [Amborella trichopoda]